MVLGRAGQQMAVGLGLGLVVGYALARPVATFSVGVDASDPGVYLVIVLTLLLTGLLATVLPARAAMRVDPVEAMRE
jgi:putative ABC transport system permease protein